MNTDLLREFIDLEKRKRELKDELKAVNKALNDIEPKVLAEFEDAGIDNMRMDGFTVYLHRQLWAGAADGDRQRLVEALVACGMEDYVVPNVNTNSISAWVREQDELDAELPEPLRDALKVSEVFSVRARKAGG